MAAKKTTDTKPVENLKEEATNQDKPRTFEYKGESFTVPPLLDMPVEILEIEDVADVNPAVLARTILGDEQWKRFKATGATVRDFNEFLGLMLGDDPGK